MKSSTPSSARSNQVTALNGISRLGITFNERFGDLDLVEALKDEDDEAGHATSELFAEAARELRVYKHAYAMHGGIKAQVNE